MLLKKIKLSNFNSFDEVEVELNDFNVLVGANASGKSNFLQALKFLKDIQEFGLENAVSLQGGIEYLRNVGLSKDTIDISFTFLPADHDKIKQFGDFSLEEAGLRKKEVTYKLTLGSTVDAGQSAPDLFRGQSAKAGSEEIELLYEEMRIAYEVGDFEISNLRKINYTEKKKRTVGYEIIFKNDGTSDQMIPEIVPEVDRLELAKDLFVELKDKILDATLHSFIIMSYRKSKKEAFLAQYLNYILSVKSYYPIYNFNPQLSRRAISVANKVELEENGENVAVTLRRILEDQDKKSTFLNIVGSLLPFVKDINIERFYEKYLLFKIRESFQEKEIPSSLLSDGTIAITMIVVALFFEKKQLTIFEEPEHGIHPALIDRLMNLFYEASQDKQIIITTHNPEVVKYTELKDLLLISRKNGTSMITRPDNSQAVHIFLDNELGIDELFTQNLLNI